jgi:hypothetical protein
MSDKVHFVSTVSGLSSIDECVPVPAAKFVPDWWKNTPIVRSSFELSGIEAGNFKNCPALKDYFAEGYILPMWSDLILYFNSETLEWAYRIADEKFKISTHSNEQYINNVNHTVLGKSSYFIFKLQSPWKIFTPEGYSTYQLPAFYHFSDDFSAAPGVRDTDRYHQMNIQLLIHSDKKEIFIPRGTPIAQLIPFKREKMGLEVRDATDKDMKKINSNELGFSTKFPGSKLYYKMRGQ